MWDLGTKLTEIIRQRKEKRRQINSDSFSGRLTQSSPLYLQLRNRFRDSTYRADKEPLLAPWSYLLDCEPSDSPYNIETYKRNVSRMLAMAQAQTWLGLIGYVSTDKFDARWT
jgi:hypothetical protein